MSPNRPGVDEWARAFEVSDQKMSTAVDRTDLIHDAITAVVADASAARTNTDKAGPGFLSRLMRVLRVPFGNREG